ncbi:hypothetical protein Halar_1008 [halophilic archaeon DL31]|jgi:hypothetical protein|nr:hypothetical protein Halar_1008 [halophilic archaeon DL31]
MTTPDPETNLRDPGGPADLLAADGSVLVRGPALTGKYELLMGLLAGAAEERLLVSTNRHAERARAEFERYTDTDPEAFAVVDCATRIQGVAGDEDPLVRYASSPKNLTEIGVKFTDLVGVFEDRGVDRVAVGVHSLSELMMYSAAEHVFQFIRIMGAECRDLGWPLAAVVDDVAVGEQAVATLAQPFDSVLTTRLAEDGGWEFAVTSNDDPEWQGF